MTVVSLKYRRIDGTNLDGALVTVGSVTITPLARRDTTTGQMTTGELTVPLAASAPSVTLAPGTYKLRVRANGLDTTEYRLVPASGTHDVDDLDEVTPTGDAALEPEWKAYIDAAIAGVTVGSTTPAGIVGSTAVGQALIVASDQAAGRTAIGAAQDSAVVHNTGTETVAGVKTFSSSPIVPTPTTSGQAATKGYVDSTVSAGAPDASTSVKGIVQLAGDLAGTATSPSVAKVKGITISGTAPTTGQALVATSSSAAGWATVTTPTITGTSDVPGLDAALAGKRATGVYEAGEMVAVRKDPTTGFWPASWSGKTPVYTGGSSSAGVRPTSSATVICVWIGPDPSPAVVSSGTAGMRDDARDLRFKHA